MDIDVVGDLNDGTFEGGAAAPTTVQDSGRPAPSGTQPANADAPAAAPEKGASLRDQLTAAFRKPNGEATDQQTAAKGAQGRERNPDGTFAAKPAETASQAAPAAPAAAPEGQQPPALSVPRSFGPAEQQQFAQLPAEMQQFVARTMESVETEAAKYQGYAQIEQVIGPRRQAWAMNGMSEGQAINQLFALSDFAGSQPEQFVQWFAQQQGIDLSMIDEGDGGDVDPVIADLRTQVSTLQGQLNQFTHGQQEQQHSAIVNEVIAFGEEKDANGNVKRPYLAELGSGFMPYLQHVMAEKPNASRTEILQEAYDRACWATPAVRAKLQAAEEAQRLAEARTRAGRAAEAGSSVTGAPMDGATSPSTTDLSLRDTLRNAFAEARGAV